MCSVLSSVSNISIPLMILSRFFKKLEAKPIICIYSLLHYSARIHDIRSGNRELAFFPRVVLYSAICISICMVHVRADNAGVFRLCILYYNQIVFFRKLCLRTIHFGHYGIHDFFVYVFNTNHCQVSTFAGNIVIYLNLGI